MNNEEIDIHPYYLIRKDNGRAIPISLYIRDRISKVVEEKGMSAWDARLQRKTTTYDIIPLFNNNSEVIISDIALDTIYSFKKMELSPIAYRIPSVHNRKPLRVVTAAFDTDYFITFRVTDLIYYPDVSHKYFDGPLIVWNKRNHRFENWNVYDLNFSDEQKIFPGYGLCSSLPPNHGEEIYRANSLVEKYKKGELKGELEEIASKLKDDDNLVLVLCKYK